MREGGKKHGRGTVLLVKKLVLPVSIMYPTGFSGIILVM